MVRSCAAVIARHAFLPMVFQENFVVLLQLIHRIHRWGFIPRRYGRLGNGVVRPHCLWTLTLAIVTSTGAVGLMHNLPGRCLSLGIGDRHRRFVALLWDRGRIHWAGVLLHTASVMLLTEFS